MAISAAASILLFFVLAQNTGAFQVTANSPCASVCLDSPGQNSSDLNASAGRGSEIVCLDSSFSSTEAGRKFEACVGCLQNSTFYSDDDGNDQGAFIYNLRYALGSCLFKFENVTDQVESLCLTNTTCEPLRDAIQDANLLPTPKTQYAYCAADHNAVLGSALPLCIGCLQNEGNRMYLSNFLTALRAGCIEQPPGGTSIGLDGTVFSAISVNITSASDSPGAPTRKKGEASLSRDSIIGISVALGVLVIITLITIIIYFRKRKNLKHRESLGSPLHSRFGASNITSPNSGAYGNPHANPGAKLDMSTLSAKELAVLAGRNIADISSQQISEPKSQSTWQDAHAHRGGQPPVYTPAEIPTHQAYIPAPLSDRTESRSNTPLHSQYSSAKSSPAYPPSRMSPGYPPQNTSSPNYPPPAAQQAQSQATRPGSTQPPVINTKLNKLSRTLSRNHGTGYNTLHSAGGGSHATDSPINISGPMIQHRGRFDFELAERERTQQEREAAERHVAQKKNWSPESASSEEQWPGNY